VQHPERGRQLALRVGHHRERQVPQVLVIITPREVDEVRVGADPQHLRVAVLEVAVAAAELRDLRRAHEREVHGPQERHRPLARMALLRDLLELAALLAAHHRLELEGRELVANGQHGSPLYLFQF
jgi:hypothetical protein